MLLNAERATTVKFPLTGERPQTRRANSDGSI